MSRVSIGIFEPPKFVVLPIQRERDLAAEIVRLLRNSQI